jgi:hypothetical protein
LLPFSRFSRYIPQLSTTLFWPIDGKKAEWAESEVLGVRELVAPTAAELAAASGLAKKYKSIALPSNYLDSWIEDRKQEYSNI